MGYCLSLIFSRLKHVSTIIIRSDGETYESVFPAVLYFLWQKRCLAIHFSLQELCSQHLCALGNLYYSLTVLISDLDSERCQQLCYQGAFWTQAFCPNLLDLPFLGPFQAY